MRISGYMGKVLEVDLSSKASKVRELDVSVYRDFIGGKGLGLWMLQKYLDAPYPPLSPKNPLIFVTGPVNGFLLSGSSKLCAVSRSPLTGLFGESYVGGFIGPKVKFAGYDAIVFIGASDKPLYVEVNGEQISFHDATHLWGKDTFETHDILRRSHGHEYEVLCIGPAGEKLVKFACIEHRKGRELGRTGMGAVMGSKKLKALIVTGFEKLEAAYPDKLVSFSRELNEAVKVKLKGLTKYGTPNIMGLTNDTGTLPTKYWTEGEFYGFEKINAHVLKERYHVRKAACYGCSVACIKVSRVKQGGYEGVEVDGPEYETLFALGPLCYIDNPETIIKANELCDRLGIDTITTGNLVGFTMECFEKGIISSGDLGFNLEFGNGESMLKLIKMIGQREGLGDVLAEGVKSASMKIGRGSERIAVHVKGLEPPGYDPRGLKGVALAYAVSVRGACHLRHLAYRPNLVGEHAFRKGKIDRFSIKGQAEMVKEQEDFYAVIDSMILCKFIALPVIGPVLWDKLVNLYNIVTGLEVNMETLRMKGEKINADIRELNRKLGYTEKDDWLPERFLSYPLAKGASKGQVVKREELQEMLREFYKMGAQKTHTF